ncbi:MAG: two-component system LytT family response regulator [Parasphingorhabdus sp.]
MSSMNKLRVIIVDDEPLALDFLRSILSELSHVVIVAECRNGKEAIAAASELVPDLMFLDIQLPGINGFEVVKALQSDVMPMVVFVTAFDQYAIDAFDLHAVDYVLKPLDNDRVGRAVERAIDRLKINKKNDHKVPLIGAISDISERIVSDSSKQTSDDVPEGMKQKLLVRDSGVIKVIPFEDIDWVDAAGDYMCVHALGETHVIRSTLRELMGKLNDNRFARIHRSTIVNIERVVTITPLQKGGSLLHLSQGETLKVSRNYRESIRSLFQ